jgi:hypothetical protein
MENPFTRGRALANTDKNLGADIKRLCEAKTVRPKELWERSDLSEWRPRAL